MIIFSLCNTCWQSYNLLIEASDAVLIKEISDENGYTCPCPRLCGGIINLQGSPLFKETASNKSLAPAIFLSGKVLYQAVKGLGLPDEIPKSKEIIEAFLRTEVREIDLEEHNGNFYLHELKLTNGVILHLTAGLKGAQIIKITKGKSNATGIHSGSTS